MVNHGIIDKIQVIRSIRQLTGLGLKESKDTSERVGVEQTLCINPAYFINTDNPMPEILSAFDLLKYNGVQVMHTQTLITRLRELAKDALELNEDELGNEILQLLLVQKLRHKNQ